MSFLTRTDPTPTSTAMSRIWDDVNDDPDVHVGPRLRNLRPKLASARSLLAPRQSSTTCDIVVPACGNPAEPMVRGLTAGGNRIRTIGPAEGIRRSLGFGSKFVSTFP